MDTRPIDRKLSCDSLEPRLRDNVLLLANLTASGRISPKVLLKLQGFNYFYSICLGHSNSNGGSNHCLALRNTKQVKESAKTYLWLPDSLFRLRECNTYSTAA